MKYIFFYSNHLEGDNTIGITQKVHGEISALKKLGYNVTYSAYTSKGAAIFNNKEEKIFELKFKFMNKKLNRILRRNLLIKCCCKFLEINNNFDFAYLRFHFFDREYNKLLKLLKISNVYTIIEAHAFPYRIWKKKRFWLTYIIDMLYTPIVRNKIDLVAIMGNEKKPWGIKSVQIDNGIDLDKYPLSESNKSSKIRLISVSNEQEGHAYYKIINGLDRYYQEGGTEDIIVNFVGVYMDSTKKLVNSKKICNRFKFLGKMSGNELNLIFNQSDLGLGAFSHRKNDTGSCIKTKEYFARGIPFINGWNEMAFSSDYPYVLKVDPKEEIVDFFKIVDFYKKVIVDVNKGVKMREFARNHYTWLSQMNIVMSEAENTL